MGYSFSIRPTNGLLMNIFHQRSASSVWMLEYPQDSGNAQHATSHSGRGTFSNFTSSELIVVSAYLPYLHPCVPGIPRRIHCLPYSRPIVPC